MANLGNFDPNAHEDMKDFTPLPAGEYLAYVVSSEVKSNKAGTGEYLKAEWDVIDGEYAGRKIFANYNLSHTNPQAAEIGQRELAAACRAMGLGAVQDSEQMHAIPCVLKLTIRKPKEGSSYGPENRISDYKPAGAGVAAPQAAAAPIHQRSGEGDTKPPWA